MTHREQTATTLHEADFKPRGFWALVVTQFQGAFNDNVYQWLIIYSLVATLTSGTGAGVVDVSLLGKTFSLAPYDYVQGISTLLFSLPFIIFPCLFGAIADRYSKGVLAIATKIMEVVIMIIGGLAFLSGSPLFIWAVLFLMATQSALFAPAKYGILPEILPERRLSWANGIIQMGTIAAIILGVLAAGKIHHAYAGELYRTSFYLVALSGLGIATAFWITRPPAANPHLPIPMNPLLPWKGMGRDFGIIWRDRVLFNVVLGYIYFWFVGTLVRANIVKFAGDTLQLSEAYQSALIGAVVMGIGLGALAAGFLSRNKIELGIIPIGALGMAFFGALMAIPFEAFRPFMSIPILVENTPTTNPGTYFYFLLFSTFGLGFFAGAFDVPLAASVQHRAPKGTVGGIIATTNMLTFVGMAVASLLFIALGTAGLSTYQVYLLTAAFSLGMGIYITFRLPHLCLRAVLWILSNTWVRIRVHGRELLPESGAALLVGSHISFIDCLAIFSATDREIHFVMGDGVFRRPIMGRLARLLHVIPIPEHATETEQAQVAKQVRKCLALGHVVCINNERQVTPEGCPVAWENNVGVITRGLDIPVVPFYITRMWQSLYVIIENRVQWRRPKQLPYPIDIRFGPPLPVDSTMESITKTLHLLGREVHTERPLRVQLLHRGFVRMARRNPFKMAIADTLTGKLSYFKTLVGSLVFARKFQQRLDQQQMVGVLLPPSLGGSLTNVALQLMGRVPINLNYTASSDVIASCARQCNVTQVLTSKKLVERLPLEVPGETIFLEDIRDSVTFLDRLIAMFLAVACPVSLIERVLGSPQRSADDLATVVFSSGSEGEPKGVMLSHRNIITNIDGTLEAFPNDRNSCIVGFLPFFHSFGFTATLWMPLIHGIRGIYHANPLEPKIIGKLINTYQGTIMIGTSTFMQGFIRRCTPEQLSSLAFIVCGAEKLAPRVRNAFKEKFGMEPLEGYGTTECAPVVSANITDCVSPGFYSPGTKHGTIGRPIPGVEVRVVDTASGEEVAAGESGLLLARGPNIMQGYLGQPEKTAKVLRDGWYETGDIANIDGDGFITITDRLARFSKVAGEMVPHTRVEEILHGLLDLTEQRLAVAGVPDTQKGERLIVLHTLNDEELEKLLSAMKTSSMPNLWIPKATAFYQIDEIPILGTGKMDIKSIKQMALAFDLGD